jgi:hypothetical protein
MDEAVERVARALYERSAFAKMTGRAWEDKVSGGREQWTRIARAALQAAIPSIAEEMARVADERSSACDELGRTHFDHTARYHNECRAIEARHIATAIRSHAQQLAGKVGEGA